MHSGSAKKTVLTLSCLVVLLGACGCKRESSGTSDDLKADYDRVVKERNDLMTDFDKRKAEIEGFWQQRVSDKEQKIADLTSENANLRQRLLVADAAGQDVPLTDAARARSVLWLHVIYLFILAACVVLVAVLMRAHVNLRERMREFLMQQARFIPTKEVACVE